MGLVLFWKNSQQLGALCVHCYRKRERGRKRTRKGRGKKIIKGKNPFHHSLLDQVCPPRYVTIVFLLCLLHWFGGYSVRLCVYVRSAGVILHRSVGPRTQSSFLGFTHAMNVTLFVPPPLFSSFHVSYSLTFILLNSWLRLQLRWLKMTPRLECDETCIIPVKRRVFTHLKSSGIWMVRWEIVGKLFGAQVVPANNNTPNDLRFLSLVIA